MFIIFFFFVFSFFPEITFADSIWMELSANNLQERTELATRGYDIISVEKDRVIVLGNEVQLQEMLNEKRLLARYAERMSPFDFPHGDEDFHTYQEMTEALQLWQKKYSQVMSLTSIGTSFEKRDIWLVRLSASAAVKPAAVFMGGHHAREHVSMEVPFLLTQYLLAEYDKKNPRVVSLFEKYEIFIIPIVNPDGKEFDISGGHYQSWRKNRSKLKSSQSYGVDLNRNYGYGWGGAGASSSPSSETYRGPSAFSEPETQVIKNWIENTPQINTLLSYHTFSQLVMWPWGHVEDVISNDRDRQLFESMGQKMAQMTGYKGMKSGDLYLASGDTCDWAYGEHGIFAFTFELDPQDMWSGGFYPSASAVDGIFKKNIEPALYLIEQAGIVGSQ